MWASYIMLTSLAPSPIESVIQEPWSLASLTTNIFCAGDTLQQIHECAKKPSLKKLDLISSDDSRIQARDNPLIIMAIRLGKYDFDAFSSPNDLLAKSYWLAACRIRSNRVSFAWLDKLIYSISLCKRLHDFPISMAVSSLSPVSTHILISALIS